MVLIVLVVLGIVLVVFGALVLLWFPSRPGGKLRFSGLEVSSIGAGLPLIALGVLAVALAVVQQPDRGSGGNGVRTAPTDTDRPSTPPTSPTGTNVPVPHDVPDCITAFFGAQPEVPGDRQRELPAGVIDWDVLRPEESKRDEFGLVFTDSGQVVGAAKMSYDILAKQFNVDNIVDGECNPVGWTATNTTGNNPASVPEYDNLQMRLGADRYTVVLEGGQPEVQMELVPTAPS